MPVVNLNGVEIFYETRGDPADVPLLLVCGLGMQMVLWTDEFLDEFVRRGFFVVAFDNRDAGLSTHFVERGVPDLIGWLEGRDANVSYTIPDMAADAAGLLGALGIESAHVAGISMGGMIVQQMAIDHEPRVRSLCSIMSTTGDHSVGQPSQAAAQALLTMEGETREEMIENGVRAFQVIGSPGYPPDTDRLRHLAGLAFDRNHEPTGIARQMGAILVSPDRTPGLKRVGVPTLVVHGDSDPLIAPSGGEATAAAVPDARLVIVEGMGHDLPPELWGQIADAIFENAARAEAAWRDKSSDVSA